MAGPVERKVQASTAAAAASGFLLWLLGRYVFRGGVPDVIVSWVFVATPGALALIAGYCAKHTPRDLPAVPPAVTSAVTSAVVSDIIAAVRDYEDAHPAPGTRASMSRARQAALPPEQDPGVPSG
jgi:hypothetical protein